MWDQPDLQRAWLGLLRIIPTYVGSTPSGSLLPSPVSNHSHVCGINSFRLSSFAFPPESFPRMWDQRRSPGPSGCLHRIIPTYVGSTASRGRPSPDRANHSHVCGINTSMAFYFVERYESFPRMWDQLFDGISCGRVARIIPTYVGSTSSWVAHCILLSNHSHVCGINPFHKKNKISPRESFPRMWDQLSCIPLLSESSRIIPTYVGSTVWQLSELDCYLESFPRMWDQLDERLALWVLQRIIPTYVGSTSTTGR